MGFFSWKTSDTNKSISNKYSIRGALPVYLLIPKQFQKEYGKYIEEKNYDGYGVFGNEDVYSLVAKWNVTDRCYKDGKLLDNEELRGIGIEIACYDEQNAALKYPIKLVENKELDYENVSPSRNASDQGYFYSLTEEKVVNESNIEDIREELPYCNLQDAVKHSILNIIETAYSKIMDSQQFTTEDLENISHRIGESEEVNNYIDSLIYQELDEFKSFNHIEDEEEESR